MKYVDYPQDWVPTEGRDCTQCRLWKPADQFGIIASKVTGRLSLTSWCSDCKADYSKAFNAQKSWERRRQRLAAGLPEYCVGNAFKYSKWKDAIAAFVKPGITTASEVKAAFPVFETRDHARQYCWRHRLRLHGEYTPLVRPPPKHKDDAVRRVRELFEQGYGYTQIAEILGYDSRGIVAGICTRHGIRRRPPSPAAVTLGSPALPDAGLPTLGDDDGSER